MKARIKYLIIQRYADKYRVSDMCNFFSVSRSGYYSWKYRTNRPDLDMPIVELIKSCQEQTKSTYGYRRVKLWLLREAGLLINHKSVLRIMNKYGLLAQVHRKRHYSRYGEYLQKNPNLLERNFKAERPNQKWVTDISFIQTAQGVLYLSVIKDLFDGFIVAYKTGIRNDNQLVLSTLKLAEKEVADGLILHSDQGFQYASTAYCCLSQEYGIHPSMSRAGTPLDNAPVESFFSTLKTECIRRQKIQTFSQARKLIEQYISFYNYQRIQLKSKLTPYEKRCQLA